jgi:hypothetical protein
MFKTERETLLMAARLTRWATRLGFAAPTSLLVALPQWEARAAEWPTPDDQVKPCRPTISCTADIVSPGLLEVEAGGLFSKFGKLQSESLELTFPVLIKLTLTRLLQLQVGSNGYTVISGNAPAQYFDNLFFGPKLHLVDQGDIRPSLALTAQLSVPTFGQDGRTHEVDAFFTGHASKDISILHVDWNVGVDAWRLDAPVAQVFTALALSTMLSSTFGVALEGYYFSNTSIVPRDGGVRLVFSTTVRPWMVVDVGDDVGFFPSTRAFSAFFGMTFIPGVLWRSS